VDLAPFLEAGALLYGGAFAAERYDAVGKFIDAHVDAVDPVVGSIITAARDRRAHELARDLDRLATLARRTDATWEECDAVMLPTVPTAFTIAAIDAEPMVHNTVLGRYTSFCNLLDLAAVAVPVAERTDGLPIGVTFVGPAWTDEQLARIASAFVRPGRLPFDGARSGLVSVVVVGAHLAGQPLNSQLVDRGGRLVAATTTAPEYRLYALDGELPKPALVRVLDGGAAIEVEVWELDEAAFGSFVASIPGPHCIGRVHLADGTEQPGFLCEPAALGPARDITRFGGWRAYLEWASSTARAQ
jgi:allophanate hydrolase